MPQYLQIAIDGPAGAGKSTVAKAVADKLSLLYIDTGAMYRAIAYKVLKQGIPLDDEERISQMLENTTIVYEYSANPRIWCDGEDVTYAIRSPEVSRAVSVIASYPKVRAYLVKQQREAASKGGVVMDGRDIGTHVLPHAQLKIFLTATPAERARRRYLELQKNGSDLSLDKVEQDILERDRRDSNREHSPLKPAPDAVIIDTTNLTIEEIVTKIVALSREVCNASV